jgi:hypothetical protein
LKNTEEKQRIRSFGVISVFSMIGLCLLAAYPVMNSEKAENGYKALHRAEGLAYQLVEIHKNLNIPTGGRNIASLAASEHLGAQNGEIGLDPWGHAYQFEIIRNRDLKSRKIAVWSVGENGKSESKETHFSGDDIGVLVDLK